MASLVDPRFRTAYIDSDQIEKIKKRALTELSLPTEKYTSPTSSVMLHEEETQPEPKKKNTLGSFFKESGTFPTVGGRQN